MSYQTIREYDRSIAKKMVKLQLPHFFKRIGIFIALAAFAFLIINKFSFDSSIYRQGAKYVILLGMLITSMSKELIEDEMIVQMRAYSIAFAFFAAILYSIALPFIDYGIDLLTNTNPAIFDSMGDFQILWFLLSIQVLSFEIIKRKNL